MSVSDKALLICIAGMILGFIIMLIDIQRSAYAKGQRDGWHRGRSMNRQEFHEE